MNIGKVVQVTGYIRSDALPAIYNALTVDYSASSASRSS